MAMHAEHARMPERRDPYLELVEMINDPSRYPCQHGLTDNPDLISDARRLHARSFLQRGYINENDIDEDGFITEKIDKYWRNSEYFVVLNEKKELQASARLIKPDARGFDSLQFFKEAAPAGVKAEDFKDFDPNKCAEISGLVKERGVPRIATFHVYRDMIRHARNEGIQLLFMTTTPSTHKLLKGLFNGAIQRVGEEEAPTPGYNAVASPTILDPNQAYDMFKNRKIDDSPGNLDFFNATVRFFADLDTKPDRIA